MPRPRKNQISTRKKRPSPKADFVRSLPATLSAREVVAKAKAAGMTLTEGYVFGLRKADGAGGAGASASADTGASSSSSSASTPKRRGRRPGRPPGTIALAKAPAKAPAPAPAARRGGEEDLSGVEHRFFALALELGLVRSTEILSDIRGFQNSR